MIRTLNRKILSKIIDNFQVQSPEIQGANPSSPILLVPKSVPSNPRLPNILGLEVFRPPPQKKTHPKWPNSPEYDWKTRRPRVTKKSIPRPNGNSFQLPAQSRLVLASVLASTDTVAPWLVKDGQGWSRYQGTKVRTCHQGPDLGGLGFRLNS